MDHQDEAVRGGEFELAVEFRTTIEDRVTRLMDQQRDLGPAERLRRVVGPFLDLVLGQVPRVFSRTTSAARGGGP
ncbi:hypothetical protein [Streptomyces sp. NPDC001980]|uniref:hypothetical protein n=1 Tax=Streptomyces sp. NPDC001980 TaxID=3157126 RepID=UPI00333238BB